MGCLLGFDGCPTPNFIIINSGYHDRRHPTKQFKKILFNFLHDLKYRYKKENKKVDIIWSGTTIITSKWESLSELDRIAYRIMEALKIPYVNSTEVVDFVPSCRSSPRKCTPDFVHFGSVAKLFDRNITGAVAMLKAQKILDEICKHRIKDKLVHVPMEKSLEIQVL